METPRTQGTNILLWRHVENGCHATAVISFSISCWFIEKKLSRFKMWVCFRWFLKYINQIKSLNSAHFFVHPCILLEGKKPHGSKKSGTKNPQKQQVRRYWPGLPDGALVADYSGVRPKLAGPGGRVKGWRLRPLQQAPKFRWVGWGPVFNS